MICKTLDKIVQLADTMASSAGSFNTGLGYEVFLKARQDLLEQVEKLKKVDQIINGIE